MTPDEATLVLATASGYDERKPSRIQSQVWADELTRAQVDAAEAIEAVKRFYGDRPDDRIKPGHVLPIVQVLRAERIAARKLARRQAAERLELETRGERRHAFEPDLDGWRPPLVLRCAAPGCGETDQAGRFHIRDRRADVERLIAQLRDKLPEGDPKFRRSLESHRVHAGHRSEVPAE